MVEEDFDIKLEKAVNRLGSQIRQQYEERVRTTTDAVRANGERFEALKSGQGSLVDSVQKLEHIFRGHTAADERIASMQAHETRRVADSLLEVLEELRSVRGRVEDVQRQQVKTDTILTNVIEDVKGHEREIENIKGEAFQLTKSLAVRAILIAGSGLMLLGGALYLISKGVGLSTP